MGETVIVAQGIYVENIRFKGKNIVLRSTNPLDHEVVNATVIDGNQADSVVTFSGTENATCILTGFTIRNGDAEYGGGVCGGTWDLRTHATIRDNLITRNSASLDGGGLHCCDGSIQNNTISENSAGNWGGGLAYCFGTICNNSISENSAGDCGGGLNNCHGTIQNNRIGGNSAQSSGGGLSGCHGTIQNNTVFGNSADRGGGLDGCGGIIRNCIVWGNIGLNGAQLHDSAAPTNCCIQDWNEGGEGNISEDPGLVDANGGDYHLQSGSCCIDRGVDHYWSFWPEWDMDGNCRLVGDDVDMGCYEYGSSVDRDGDLLCHADELSLHTNPDVEDSDADSLRDGLEVLRGTNPCQNTRPGTIRVPSDIPAIQKALSLSVNGEEIVVASGIYGENLQFCGADVVLRSANQRDPEIIASTIIDGGGAGPAVWFTGRESEACILAGFTIRNGRAEYGSGICGGSAARHTHATIQNNTISGNSSTWAGGLWGCDGTIQNNTICGNSATSGGSGLCWCGGTIRNNLITANSASAECGWGDGLSYCNGTIQNNTITGNSAGENGGGLDHCSGTVSNCIIWANTAPQGTQLSESSAPIYSCIQDWAEAGEGNIVLDPQFVDADGADDNPDTFKDNNYRLRGMSPCIDAGKNEPWMSGGG
jgi:hypothetical protein